MKQGCLIYAFNNEDVDYILIAKEAARRVKLFLNVPVCIVTDSTARVDDIDPNREIFDIVIDVWKDESNKSIAEMLNVRNLRDYADGSMSFKKANFKNSIRTKTFQLTPFEETLVIDSDYMLANDILKHCWNQHQDFLIYQTGFDMTGHRRHREFERVSDYTVDFYWATAFWFKKTPNTEILFNLIDHIRENWDYYRLVYQFSSHMYRNDHAFSIALHMINGYTGMPWAGRMPGRMLYTLDRDVLISMNDTNFKILLEKQDRTGEYTLQKLSDVSLHIMNKFSLLRSLRGESYD